VCYDKKKKKKKDKVVEEEENIELINNPKVI
jgi:hypothetical protein